MACSNIPEDIAKDILNTYKKDDYNLVVAIDFGTASSGYAFSLRSDPTKIQLNRNWGASAGVESFKTPTCILFDQHKKTVAFGYDAQKQYFELDDNRDKNYYLFEFFKMELHKRTRLDAHTTIEALNGKKMDALKVFSEALRYLKDHFINSLKDSTLGSVTEKAIRWVITVPAIWSFKSKGFMREAAVEAGLITKETPKRLIIALEPESASIFCRNLEIKHFADMPASDEKLKLAKGTKYILLDAGGGTLDVSVHEVDVTVYEGEKHESVKEVHFATGGAYGGVYVDRAFTKLMIDVFGSDFITKFKNEHPSQWMQLMVDFEQKKKACKPEDEATTKLQLSYALGTAYTEHTGKDMKKTCKNKKDLGVGISNGMIRLKHGTMIGLFDEIVKENVKHIAELLTERGITESDIKYLFMVGGFSNSELLQTEVRKTFGPDTRWDMTILKPQEASVAVLMGAVSFGHSPWLIKERKSTFFYGIIVRSGFNPKIHDAKYKKTDRKGKSYVLVYDLLLPKGAQLGVENAGNYHPTYADQTSVSLEVFATDTEPPKDKVIYREDEKIWCLGEIIADMPGKGTDRKIDVYLSFSGTEIDVRAVCTPGNKMTTGFVNSFKSK